MQKGDLSMNRICLAMAAVGIAALSLTTPAEAGTSDVVAAAAGLGIGAIVGSALAPQAVYVAPPPPPVYYVPPPRTCLLWGVHLWTTSVSLSLPPAPGPVTFDAHLGIETAKLLRS